MSADENPTCVPMSASCRRAGVTCALTLVAAVGLSACASYDRLSAVPPAKTTHLSDEMIRQIGAEYDKGRLLLIGTTNLDAGKAVTWNIGALAKSGRPEAPQLIRRVLLASASVPGVFPPVMLNVELDGKTYQEMHGDGGAMRQEFLYPSTISRRSLPSSMRARKRTAYVIRNGKLAVKWEQVERRTLPIAGRAISTLLTSSGVDGLYRIYMTSRRDGVDYNLAFIEADFSAPHKEPFDRQYMNELFAFARAKARTGYPWRKAPPDFAS